jgi:hypothetical protein
MKVRINATIHERDNENSTNRQTEDGRVVGNLVSRVHPAMAVVDLAEDEALRLLTAFPGSLKVGEETPEDLEWIAMLEKQRNAPRMPTQAPTRGSAQTQTPPRT